MVGLCFFFEQNDVDVWSGRDIDLDAWNYAATAAGDVTRVIVINTTDARLSLANPKYEMVKELPELTGRVASLICPWNEATEKQSLWDFDHDVDWYVFGPAAGWRSLGIVPTLGIFIPMASTGALHAVHTVSTVMTHRFWRLGDR